VSCQLSTVNRQLSTVNLFGGEMEEINNTPILEEIEQKLDSMNLADKVHVLGDLACEISAATGLQVDEKIEEIGDRIRSEIRQMKIGDVFALLNLLKKIANTL